MFLLRTHESRCVEIETFCSPAAAGRRPRLLRFPIQNQKRSRFARAKKKAERGEKKDEIRRRKRGHRRAERQQQGAERRKQKDENRKQKDESRKQKRQDESRNQIDEIRQEKLILRGAELVGVAPWRYRSPGIAR